MAFITKSNVKTELDMDSSDTDYDTLLDALCAAVLSIWDELTGRTWASTAHTEYHSTPDHQETIFLKNCPVNSEASFDLYDDPDWEYTSADLVDTDEYTVDYDNGIIYRDAPFFKGKRNIKVVYTAGYSDSNVPSWLKQLLVRQVCVWYKQAKTGTWHIQNLSPAGAGSINYQNLKNNLLPEFIEEAERHQPQIT